MYGQLRKQKGKNILRDLAVVEMFFAKLRRENSGDTLKSSMKLIIVGKLRL